MHIQVLQASPTRHRSRGIVMSRRSWSTLIHRVSAAIAIAGLVSVAPVAAQSATSNQLTAKEKADGWTLLFDGKTFTGWRGLGYDTVPNAHWKIADGAIRKLPSGVIPRMPDGQPSVGGDLMTIAKFRDFELAWQWKVVPGSNSGVKYNVSEEFSLQKASNHAALGFEYQILDEWNSSRLVFRGNHGEHWLNGVKVVEFDLGTPRMDSALAKSKYRSITGFAERKTGHIILQDHGEEAFYRDIKIRTFKP
jgi:hypothetical protein